MLPLFDELHSGDATDHLCARGYPEDGVTCHWLRAVDTAFSACVGEQDFTFPVHSNKDADGDSLRIIGDLVYALTNASGGRLGEAFRDSDNRF